MKHKADCAIRMFGLLWKYAKKYVIAEIIMSLIYSVQSISAVIFAKLFYDCLEQNAPFAKAAEVVGIMLLWLAAYHICNEWYTNKFAPVQKAIFQQKMQGMLYKKASEVDMQDYDREEFYDAFIWSMNQCDAQILGMLKTITSFMTNILAAGSTIVIISSIDLTLAGVALLCTAAGLVIEYAQTRITYDKEVEINTLERKNAYIERVFSLPDYARQIRTNDVAGLLKKKYETNLNTARRTEIRFKKRELKFEIPDLILTQMMQPLVYGYLIFCVLIRKSMTVAGLAVEFTAFWELWTFLENIAEFFVKIPKHVLYMEKVFTFLEMPSKIHDGSMETPDFKILEAKNVSFGYSEKKKELKHIDLTIRKDEKIALVGDNGAGKTTFIKLLLRLYEPDEGELLYNGKPLENFSLDSYRERIGVVLQDFRLFAETIAENVLCSRYQEEDKQKVLDALSKATFQIEDKEYPEGILSQVTKEFDENGIQFSGGEAQKIAIARAFAKECDVLILDEPSSALDPKAEGLLLKSMLEETKGKTVLFISHRLSMATAADRIYVFDSGRIVESGSHAQLMEKCGKYAKMFRLQAEKYLE